MTTPISQNMTEAEREPHRGIRKGFNALAFLGFFAIAVALFYPGFHSRMIYDSGALIGGNENVFSRHDLSEIIAIVPQRPLFMVSLFLNYLLNGVDPFGYCLLNAMLLAGAGLALGLLIIALLDVPVLATRLTVLQRQWVGALAGLVFVVHPLQCFVVLYVWQRATIMACLFYYSALAVYISGRSRDGSRPGRWHIAASLLLLGGMLSKENVATFPIVALAAELVLFRQDLRQLVRRALVIAAITLVPLVVQFLFTMGFSGAETSDDQQGLFNRVSLYYEKAGLSFWEVFLTECRILFSYLLMIVAPFFDRLQLLKPEIVSRSLWSPPVTLAAVAGVAGLVAAAVALMRRRPLASFGIIFFIVSLIPECFLIPQYLYFGHRPVLPMAGVLMIGADAMAVFLAGQGKIRSRLAISAALVLVACLAATTVSQARRWTPLLFWQDASDHLPEFTPDVEKYAYQDVLSGYASELSNTGNYSAAIPWFREAAELFTDPKSGKQALAMGYLGMALINNGNRDEGIDVLRQSIKLNPRGAWPRYNLGVALMNKGEKEAGLAYIREAVALYPTDLDSRLGLGDILSEAGDYSEAMEQYKAAAVLAPRSPKVHGLLGITHEKTGNLPLAIESYRKAVQYGQDSAEAYFNLGKALNATGKTDEAIDNYRKALKLKPGFGPALANLGTLLLKSRQMEEAADHLEKATEVFKDNAELFYQRGVALAALEMREEAIESFRKALSLKPDHAGARQGLGKLER